MDVSLAPSTPLASLASRHPGSLVNLDAAAVGSPIAQIWERVFAGEIHSPRFSWEEKESGWACRILCPTKKEALGACLSALAEQPKPVVWLSVENLGDDAVTDLAEYVVKLPALRALYLDGSFTRRGTDALLPSLRRISTLQHLWLHQGHIEFLSVGEANPSLEVLSQKQLLGKRVDQFLSTPIEEESEGSLEVMWLEFLKHPELVGEQFCWKRIERNEKISIECHISGDRIEESVFFALISFLSKSGVPVSLGISSQAFDDRMMGFVSGAIVSFSGTLALALTGRFTDEGVDALISALQTCPDKIRSLSTQGAYSWDKAQELSEAAHACKIPRISISLPRIAFPKRKRNSSIQ